MARFPRFTRPFRIAARAVVALVGVAGPTTYPEAGWAAGEAPLTILTLSSYHADLPFARVVEAGIRETVAGANPLNRTFFEYLDAARFDLSGFAGEFAALLDRKYADVKPDVVILWADDAVGFADSHWNALHADKVVAMDAADDALARLRGHDPAAAALTVPADTESAVRTTLEVAKPATLVLVGDSSNADQTRYHREFLDAWRRLDPARTTLVDLFDTPLSEVLPRVAALPAGSAIHYGLTFRDEWGDPVRPADVAERLTRVANAPVFSQWDTMLNRGVVGGRMLSGRMMGEMAGRAALAVARDDLSSLDAARKTSVHRDTFDGTLLERWNIPLDRLPVGSDLINPPPDIWTDYREWVIGGIAVTATLGALSLLLATSLRSRDRAVGALARERHLLARRVDERTAELARSNAELEGFAYAVAHDLRAPLRAIAGYVRLLERSIKPRLTPEETEFLGTVAVAARRMDGMIRGLLDYARVGVGEGARVESIPIAAAIDEVLETIQAPILHPAAVISARIAPDATMVTANRTNFIRLIQNLVENALKYRHPEREPVIGIDARVEGSTLRLTVSDNGVGIPAEHRDRVFRLFQRLTTSDASADNGGGGFGVGLALCRRIVETHGGDIRIDSAPGAGTTFVVTLPLGHVPGGGRGVDHPGGSAAGDRSAAGARSDDHVVI